MVVPNIRTNRHPQNWIKHHQAQGSMGCEYTNCPPHQNIPQMKEICRCRWWCILRATSPQQTSQFGSKHRRLPYQHQGMEPTPRSRKNTAQLHHPLHGCWAGTTQWQMKQHTASRVCQHHASTGGNQRVWIVCYNLCNGSSICKCTKCNVAGF